MKRRYRIISAFQDSDGKIRNDIGSDFFAELDQGNRLVIAGCLEAFDELEIEEEEEDSSQQEDAPRKRGRPRKYF